MRKLAVLTSRDRLAWTPIQRHLALALLCAIALFNLVDRQIMTILIEPVRKEFGVSDTMIGLLTGAAFAIFYSAASIPLARLSDRVPRGLVISAVVGAWSVLTAMGGLAGSFTQLALTRVGVSIGEAGSSPSSYSMLSDLYPLEHRAKAFAVLAASTSIGIGAAIIAGGWLVDHVGWRLTLVAVGAPGLLLSICVLCFLKEPGRGMSDPLPADKRDIPYSVSEVASYLWKLRSFKFAALVNGFGAATGYGLLFWGPTFMMRVHGMTATKAGLVFGTVSILALVAGQILVGILVDFAGRYDVRAYLWFAGGGCLLAIPFGVLFATASDWPLAVVGFGLMSFFIAPHSTCVAVICQSLVPPRMRGMAQMVLALTITIFGMGIAPLLIGNFNDLMTPYFGRMAIRYSIIIFVFFLALAAASAFIATRWVRQEYEKLAVGAT